MLRTLAEKLASQAPVAEAHCDGPCGIYDPSSARIAAEAVLSMTKKIAALTPPDPTAGAPAIAAYLNTMTRYIAIKEEESEKAKREILILWTDFFKPEHLDKVDNLHDTFWKAAKLCSKCKVEGKQEDAEALLAAVKNIHEVFWKVKGRDVTWYTAG